ncbi:MAG TPA: M48 family metallopeptidase [Bacteroidota bacterium]|nr:M48 family metallopeptidase [Bacteroidota bacterium]
MVSGGLTPPRSSPPRPTDAKAYHRIRLFTGIASSLLTLALLVALVTVPAGRALAAACTVAGHGAWGALLLYGAAVALIHEILTLPLDWFASFRVEHAFGLSAQSPGRWAWERAKGLAVGAPLGAGALCLLYFCLTNFGDAWWLPAGVLFTALGVLLARLAPVLILPLFYRLTPLEEGPLKARITRLAEEAGVRSAGVFSFDLSRNTHKANAALTGIGRARRILLGDTLLAEFPDDEIETVFAHELGHLRHRHIWRGIALGTAVTFAGLFAVSRLYPLAVSWCGTGGVLAVGSLPLLGIWFMFYSLVTSPLGNAFSRRNERQADAYAVRATGKREAFASALRRLGDTNLADPHPHPAIEFLFYGHPPVGKRIAAVLAER